MAEEYKASRPALGLIGLYREAERDLDRWLERFRDLSIGTKHVQSAKRQIERRIAELEKQR